jgi:hypothetical protein
MPSGPEEIDSFEKDEELANSIFLQAQDWGQVWSL